MDSKIVDLKSAQAIKLLKAAQAAALQMEAERKHIELNIMGLIDAFFEKSREIKDGYAPVLEMLYKIREKDPSAEQHIEAISRESAIKASDAAKLRAFVENCIQANEERRSK